MVGSCRKLHQEHRGTPKILRHFGEIPHIPLSWSAGRGRVLASVDSGLIMKAKPKNVEMARVPLTHDMLVAQTAAPLLSAGCSTHLQTVKVCTKWRFELKCCDSNSGPWASCEQRADLMRLHNPERSSDWLHKPVKGSGSGWELSSAERLVSQGCPGGHLHHR